jgi:hypothetical protein
VERKCISLASLETFENAVFRDMMPRILGNYAEVSEERTLFAACLAYSSTLEVGGIFL